jgi:hypothetical protein
LAAILVVIVLFSESQSTSRTHQQIIVQPGQQQRIVGVIGTVAPGPDPSPGPSPHSQHGGAPCSAPYASPYALQPLHYNDQFMLQQQQQHGYHPADHQAPGPMPWQTPVHGQQHHYHQQQQQEQRYNTPTHLTPGSSSTAQLSTPGDDTMQGYPGAYGAASEEEDLYNRDHFKLEPPDDEQLEDTSMSENASVNNGDEQGYFLSPFKCVRIRCIFTRNLSVGRLHFFFFFFFFFFNNL